MRWFRKRPKRFDFSYIRPTDQVRDYAQEAIEKYRAREAEVFRSARNQLNPPSRESLAQAWWDGVNAQMNHTAISERIAETENPYKAGS